MMPGRWMSLAVALLGAAPSPASIACEDPCAGLMHAAEAPSALQPWAIEPVASIRAIRPSSGLDAAAARSIIESLLLRGLDAVDATTLQEARRVRADALDGDAAERLELLELDFSDFWVLVGFETHRISKESAYAVELDTVACTLDVTVLRALGIHEVASFRQERIVRVPTGTNPVDVGLRESVDRAAECIALLIGREWERLAAGEAPWYAVIDGKDDVPKGWLSAESSRPREIGHGLSVLRIEPDHDAGAATPVQGSRPGLVLAERRGEQDTVRVACLGILVASGMLVVGGWARRYVW